MASRMPGAVHVPAGTETSALIYSPRAHPGKISLVSVGPWDAMEIGFDAAAARHAARALFTAAECLPRVRCGKALAANDRSCQRPPGHGTACSPIRD